MCRPMTSPGCTSSQAEDLTVVTAADASSMVHICHSTHPEPILDVFLGSGLGERSV
jgi:hypothetical protein